MNRARSKLSKRLLSFLMAGSLLMGFLPAMAFDGDEGFSNGEIIAFEPLEERVENRTVPLGTSLEDLDLPNTLTATVEITAPADSVQDLEEPPQEDDVDIDKPTVDNKDSTPPSDTDIPVPKDSDAPSGSESPLDETRISQITLSLPVTWTAQPDYDGDSAGTYLFIAAVENIPLASGVEPLQITVTVIEAGGEITVFEELDEAIRFQRGQEVILPETLKATVNGGSVDVPVSWESETDADQSGLHIFTASPDDGYILADGVKKPVLSFYRTRMIMARMAGSGNTNSPLEITTAAQLAEIAALTNAGKLEETVFGTSEDVQVHLLLMNDLDISGQGDADGWVPIGADTRPFRGQLDGGGYTIEGLAIDRPDGLYQGLFGIIGDDSWVSNLGLVNVSVVGNSHVGGVAGLVRGGTVENGFVTGSVTGSSFGIGGIAGSVSNGTVKNCFSTAAVIGSINSSNSVGGVVGNNAGTIEYCAALNSNVTAAIESNVGRIAGTGSSYSSYAFSGMKVNGNTIAGGDSDDKNGSDLSADQIAADGTLFGLFTEDNGWTTANGSIPGLNGRPIEMPAQLLGDENPFSAGDGLSADTAYEITTAAQLAKLAELVNAGNTNYNSAYYKLMNDLDLSGIDPNGDKTGWVPIGTGDNPFSGYFNGNGKTITDLTIHRIGSDYQGLFGYMDGGEISNLGLVKVSVSGKDYVGGVAGMVYHATITNCYSTGNVSGSDYVGGVAGYVLVGMVENCYSSGSVNGVGNSVGGVAGYVAYVVTVKNCFSMGSVTGFSNVGGVAGGKVSESTVINCAALNPSVATTGGSGVGRVTGSSGSLYGNYAFSGMKVNGYTVSDGDAKNGTGKTAAEIAESGTLFNLFTDDTIWKTANGSLPGLFGQTVDMPVHLLDDANLFSNGDGSDAENAYEITTAAQLAKLAELVNAGNTSYNSAYYKLMNDLDLSGIDPNGDKTGWVPIGIHSFPFEGHFNGNGKTITGLTIRSVYVNQGLFGFIDDGGTVSDLGLLNVSIRGNSNVGGVAGGMDKGVIENCFVTGNIIGSDDVGGVVGEFSYSEAGDFFDSRVKNCLVNANVSGSNRVGGVAGGATNVTVENCIVTGNVSGSDRVGGVVGRLYGTAENCAALNLSVTATDSSNAGRVVGRNSGALTGNYAFDGMTVTAESAPKVLDQGIDKADGADMTATNAITPVFWTEEMDWDSAVWDIRPEKLPVLRSLPTDIQSNALGLYLSQKSAENLLVTVEHDSYMYTGSLITPNITVKFGGQTLTETQDYTLAITSVDGAQTSAGINAGIVTVTVTGNGRYSGTKNITFTIMKANEDHPDGSSDSDDSAKQTVTTPAVPQINLPISGSVRVKAGGIPNAATFTLTESLIKTALENARATAKSQNRSTYDVEVQIMLDASSAAGMSLTLERTALNQLVNSGAKRFEIAGAPISFALDSQALLELQKQSTGSVTFTAKSTSVSGVRNAYDITLSTVKDGKTLNISNLGTGSATLSIPCTPDKNEDAGYLYAIYVDETGKQYRIADSFYDANSESLIFSTNHFSVYGVGYTASSAKLDDISAHWAKESIDYVVGRGLFSGDANGKFHPEATLTWGELVTALGKLVGADAPIEWAYNNGILQGKDSSKFVADQVVTRQEMAMILRNYAKATGYTLPVTRIAAAFADASNIGSTYKPVVTALQQAGVMMGEKNNRFNPTATVTRAEVSVMLHRYIKLTIDPSTAQGWAMNDDGQFLYYKDGKVVTGTQTIHSVKYFFNMDGTLKTGWAQDEAGNRRFYWGNKLLTGWWDIGANGNNKRYYFDANGSMVFGKWLEFNGRWYYFYTDGALARNVKVDGFEVDDNGARIV